MNCWLCKEELIWGRDDDINPESEDFHTVTNLSCPNCNAYVEVYHPKEEEV